MRGRPQRGSGWPPRCIPLMAPHGRASPRSSVFVHLERGDERLLRDLHLAELAHPLLALLLLFEKLALSRDVAAVTLSKHILAQRSDGLARDDAPADRCLDRNLEEVRRNELLQLLAHGAAAAVGARTMHDHGKRVDGLAVDQDRHLDEVTRLIALDMVVERGVAATDRFQSVVEIEYHLIERQLVN